LDIQPIGQLSGILEQGPAAGAFPPFDTRTLPLMINGALDAVVAEWIGAPDLDLDTAPNWRPPCCSP
jgi:hypothetical protein